MNCCATNVRSLSAIALGVVLTLSALSQDANPGQRGGRGEWGGMNGGGGVTGTVTEVAADHYIIKTDAGETYTILFSANTRIMKQTVRQRGEGGGNPPQPLKSTDIKVGDAVAALGEVNAAAKSVGAVVVLQLDPERAKQFREMQANFGKTWLMGKVTAIDGTKVSIFAAVDNAAHAFVADENTTFRKHREPITLTDVQVGDRVRVEGAVKDGIFVAASVTVMGMPQGGAPSVPHDGAPPTTPPSN
ncbi:MAG: DUF5666 domain-containing protein [Terracidiphilus sp.]|jgi:hypothetical protein